jgi:HK97 family phage prohead protease
MERKVLDFTVGALDFTGRTVEGYASIFGNVDLGDDVIHPGAFAKTLAERGNKVKFFWQHDPAEPLGRVLELQEDARGLFFKAVVSDTARGRDALALLRDGAISGMSIGYDPIAGGVDFVKTADGRTLRNLREVRLWEVSLVSMPMNESANVTALKADEPPAAVLDPTATDTAPAPDPFGALEARIAALEARFAPAEDAGRVEEPPTAEAGPDTTPPTSHAVLAALQELGALLGISNTEV